MITLSPKISGNKPKKGLLTPQIHDMLAASGGGGGVRGGGGGDNTRFLDGWGNGFWDEEIMEIHVI